MQEFKIGDIVKLKSTQDITYFIVTDVVDFSKEGDEQPNIECEVGQIYPVDKRFSLNLVNQENLEIVARYNTKESKMMLDFLKREREKLGMFDYPIYIDIVKHNLGQVEFEEIELKDGTKASVVEPAKKNSPITIKPKFGEKEIKAILKDTQAQDEIDTYVEYMDAYLDLLNKALQNGDKKEIEFRKSQLEKVRQKLMELEYFKFVTRPNVMSIKIDIEINE
jgi:hypothetical protein